MRALVFRGPNLLEVEDRPVPSPGAGEAVVAVRAAGICGSDVHGYTGASGRRRPNVVMGHEVAGVVHQVGSGVDEGLVGQSVVVFPLVSCGECRHCQADKPQLCSERTYLGVHTDGGFAEYTLVDASRLYRLEGSVDYAQAALAEPLAVAIHAVSRAGKIGGASVLVAGAGAIGTLIGVVARRQGASSVAITDIEPMRRQAANDLGVDYSLDPASVSFAANLSDRYPDGADVSFDAAGIQATFDQCVHHTRTSGVVVAVGGWQRVEIDLGDLVTRELLLTGTFNFNTAEFRAAVDILADEDLGRLVTTKATLEEGAALFERLAEKTAPGLKAYLAP